MKSTSRNVGSLNLRGKREKVLGCRCCVAINLKRKFEAIEHSKFIAEGWGGVE